MKFATTISAILATCSVMAQDIKKNTLEVNYNTSYKNVFNAKVFTRLSERDNWGLKSFNTAASLRIVSGLSVTYDLSRSHELNANMISRYGLGYQFSKSNFNINMSLRSVNGALKEDGIHGRIDLSVNFK